MIREYGITSIALCGSYASNQQGKKSDIDIVIELDSANHFRSFFGLKRYLEKLLGSDHIDLGIEHAIKPAVRDEILKHIRYV